MTSWRTLVLQGLGLGIAILGATEKRWIAVTEVVIAFFLIVFLWNWWTTELQIGDGYAARINTLHDRAEAHRGFIKRYATSLRVRAHKGDEDQAMLFEAHLRDHA